MSNTKMLLCVLRRKRVIGHLMPAFIASVIVKMLHEKLKDTIMTFLTLRIQKCRVYDDKVITGEDVKKSKDVLKLFKKEATAGIPIED